MIFWHAMCNFFVKSIPGVIILWNNIQRPFTNHISTFLFIRFISLSCLIFIHVIHTVLKESCHCIRSKGTESSGNFFHWEKLDLKALIHNYWALSWFENLSCTIKIPLMEPPFSRWLGGLVCQTALFGSLKHFESVCVVMHAYQYM